MIPIRPVLLVTCALLAASASRGLAQTAPVPYTTVVRGTPKAATSGSAVTYAGGDNLAIDQAGNLLVLKSGIQKVTPAGAVSTLIASAGINLSAIAVDASGTAYVIEDVTGNIIRITPAGDRTQVFPIAGSSGFSGPGALAFSPAGILYVGDLNGVWKMAGFSFTRYAGGGTRGTNPLPVDGAVGVATFDPVDAMVFDAQGNLFVTGFSQTVRKVTSDGTTTTIAGAPRTLGSGDGPGPAARFNHPVGIAVDSNGVLYIADSGNATIRRIGTDGNVTTIAGTAGTHGTADGPAASATFTNPTDVAVDAAGNLFIADGTRIRRLSAAGVVSTLVSAPAIVSAGTASDIAVPKGLAIGPGVMRYVSDAESHTIRVFEGRSANESVFAGRRGSAGSADGLAAPSARFAAPRDGVFDAAGNAYVIDGSAIRRIAPDGTTSTFAGRMGVAGSADGTGTAARFTNPLAITIGASGTLYVAEQCGIRKITAAGVVTRVAGGNTPCSTIDGTGAGAHFSSPQDIVVDASGTLFVGEGGTVRSITPAGVVTTIAGLATFTIFSADGTGTFSARFRAATGIAIEPGGTMYVADQSVIRKVTPDGVVTTIAGLASTTGTADGDGSAARFTALKGLTLGPDGVLYASDANRIRAVTLTGHVVTLAGDLAAADVDGPATVARFNNPAAVAVDASGLVFVFQGNGRVRTVTAAGVAGTYINGTPGTQADGTLSAPARFNAPTGIARASDGTIFVADTGNHTIRRIAANVASTVAGAAGVSGLADGNGAAARFDGPEGIAVDAAGILYVADRGNSAIRKIAPGGGVSTIPGPFINPRGIAVAGNGTIYVADTGNHVIRAISAAGNVTTLAGSPGSSGSGDGLGGAARFSSPTAVVVAADGTLYVADSGNHTIRTVSSGGVVTTIGGAAGALGFADGSGTDARFNDPGAMALDASGGGLYIADTGNAAVRVGVVGPASGPIITGNPANRSAALHGTAQFSCDAVGTPSPTFSWEVSPASGGLQTLANNSIYTGVDTATLTIADAPAALNGARFNCFVANSAGSARSAPATLTVHVLTLSPARLIFSGVADAAGGLSTMSPAQSVKVGWQGTGAPPWTVTADQPWVHVTGGSGAGSGTFTVSVTDPGSSPSFGSANLMLTSTADPELTMTLPVTFRRLTSDAAPIGVVDTPANNATGLQGSLAVTGWALDDVAVARVEIWRDQVPGETTPVFVGSGPGNGKIFIAFASFVPGARPDVEAQFQFTYPQASVAGWGYMLLTQGLWNQGNGTYKLYAFAFDTKGNATTIGSKTIAVDNAHATKPFGTIDTPSYGGTVSGMIQNFGWALTPGLSCSIANPNVLVSIDSGALTPVVYGDVRSDIAGAFTGYTNAPAAGAHYTLDTTTLSNGMHTIGWLVTDSCGRVDGVGSRFFTVANSSSMATASESVRQSASEGALAARSFSEGGWALVRGTTPVDAPPSASDGTRVVRIEQGERIELHLPGNAPYVARLIVGGEPRDLPIGSSFDAAEGTFYWQPAAGFLGAYDLQFTAGTRVERVRAVVGPPIRMVIDTPHAGNVLASSGFSVAGWAVDLASLGGAGIDTLHAWAYPADGGAPVFVGVAKVGGRRPDVAALYGDSFGSAGYSVNGSLTPGTYDLVVFAHSAASNAFAAAETVRVIVR